MVGVTGFEPATSSSRSNLCRTLTCAFAQLRAALLSVDVRPGPTSYGAVVTNPKISRGRAKATTAGSVVDLAVVVRDWLGDGCESDGVAEGFELLDVFAGGAVRVGAAAGVVRAEVVVAGLGLRQQVPDDDQDRPPDRDGGSRASAAAGQASVAVAEEGVGARGGDGGFAEGLAEVGVAVSGGTTALVLPGGLVDSGGETGPRAQVRRGGEAGHVQTDLGEDGPGGGGADAGDLIQTGHHGRERRNQLLDAGLDGGDVGAGFVDAGQHQAQQEGVVLGELPNEGLFQQGDLGSHPGAGQLREHR